MWHRHKSIHLSKSEERNSCKNSNSVRGHWIWKISTICRQSLSISRILFAMTKGKTAHAKHVGHSIWCVAHWMASCSSSWKKERLHTRKTPWNEKLFVLLQGYFSALHKSFCDGCSSSFLHAFALYWKSLVVTFGLWPPHHNATDFEQLFSLHGFTTVAVFVPAKSYENPHMLVTDSRLSWNVVVQLFKQPPSESRICSQVLRFALGVSMLLQFNMTLRLAGNHLILHRVARYLAVRDTLQAQVTLDNPCTLALWFHKDVHCTVGKARNAW